MQIALEGFGILSYWFEVASAGATGEQWVK
jgi:hypothetical protein